MKKLLHRYDRLIANKNRKLVIDKTVAFFKFDDFKALTCYVLPKHNLDPDFSIEDSIEDSESDYESESEKPRPKGRPKSTSPLFDQSDSAKTDKLKPLYEYILKFCGTEKVDIEPLLTFLLRKFFWNSNDPETYDFQKGQIYHDLFNQNDSYNVPSLSVEESDYILENLDIGFTQYDNLARKLRPYVKFASADKVRKLRDGEQPDFEPPTHHNGLWANLKSCVTKMTQGAINHLVDKEKLDTMNLNGGLVEFQTGFDASGKHKQIASAPLPDKNCHHITVGKFHLVTQQKVACINQNVLNSS